jgi:hypothetical protein
METYKLTKEKPSVCICIINNYDSLPSYFVWSLFALYNYTKNHFPQIYIQQINACSIQTMRNLAVETALGKNQYKKKFDYLVQLDSDHNYKEDFIVKFIEKMQKEDIQILTGMTASQKPPHLNTQYYKITTPINSEKNCVKNTKDEQITKIEASGPVGMVINTKVFDKLNFPYYFERYELPTKKIPHYTLVGSDIWFMEECKKAKIPIYCMTNYKFPHQKLNFI